MDTVFIEGLNVDTIIGCYEHEKHRPQPLLFDIEMAWDTTNAARSDALEEALDYDAVRKAIEGLLADTRFELVEAVAENVSDLIMREFQVLGLRLKVSKPEAIGHTRAVGVKIARGISF